MKVLKSFTLVLKRYRKSMEISFWKCVGTLLNDEENMRLENDI